MKNDDDEHDNDNDEDDDDGIDVAVVFPISNKDLFEISQFIIDDYDGTVFVQ